MNMVSLKVKIRKKIGKEAGALAKKGLVPAVLYGPEIKNINVEVKEKELEKTYKEAGKTSLILIEVEDGKGDKSSKKIEALIHEVVKDPISGRFIHADFYHPSSKKEIEAEIPLVFEGESLTTKELGGTLIREIHSIKVKGLARDLPREIKVDVSGLETFEDRIRVKDLNGLEKVKVLRGGEEIVALVLPPQEEKEEETPKAETAEVKEIAAEGGTAKGSTKTEGKK